MVLKEHLEKINLPGQYFADEEGVHYVKPDSSLSGPSIYQISHQIFGVVGQLYDPATGNGWSTVIGFFDDLGTFKTATIENAALYSNPKAVYAELAKQGLYLITSKPQCDFIHKLLLSKKNEAPLPVTDKCGFYEDTGVFVLPDNNIVPPYYDGPQPWLNANITSHREVITQKGGISNWKSLMAAAKSPLNILMLSTGLTNIYLKILNIEPFGIHIYGASSSGKTNAARAAASLWGKSSSTGKTFINKWGTTLNGLELLCTGRSGLILTLDEIRQFRGNFESVAYQILDGVGRTRMRSSLDQADQWHWEVVLISTGELSSTTLTKKGGGDIYTGAEIRILNIPVDIMQQLSGEQLSTEIADMFRQKLGDNYGLAGPEMVQALHENYNSFQEMVDDLQEWFEHSKSVLSELFPDSQSIQRVLPRFALIHMAGTLASQAEIFPFSEEEVTEAVKIAISAWLDEFEAPSDVERAVQDLRSQIITNAHRIIHLESAEDNNLKPIAYCDDQYYYFTREHIREITSHVSEQLVAKELKRIGALYITEGDRLQVKRNIPGLALSRVYAVKQEFFGEPSDDSEKEFNTEEDTVTPEEILTALEPVPEYIDF